jgi:ribonuclease HII
MWVFEEKARKRGFAAIAGVDEAGRGPLAGPVVSAAVILPADFPESDVNDSKQLSPKKRSRLYDLILAHAVSVGIGQVEADEIDRMNILQASLLSMKKAVDALEARPDYLLIDGMFTISLPIDQEAVVKGDSLSISIASASIIAKVTRDRLMAEYDEVYPQYGFASHKGYPTRSHRAAVQKLGPCLIHRRTFKGVKEYV